MKKIISLILTVVMVCCLSVTAFADSSPTEITHEMSVSAYSYSSFFYSIPETLEIMQSFQEFEVGISEYDLDDDYAVIFEVENGNNDNTITLTNTKDESKTVKIGIFNSNYGQIGIYTKPVVMFTQEELNAGTNSKTLYAGFGNMQTQIKAGTYTGVVTFNVYADLASNHQ